MAVTGGAPSTPGCSPLLLLTLESLPVPPAHPAGEVSQSVGAKLLQLCQALDGGDFVTATHLQASSSCPLLCTGLAASSPAVLPTCLPAHIGVRAQMPCARLIARYFTLPCCPPACRSA